MSGQGESKTVLGWAIPQDSRMKLVIEPMDGEFMNAELIGGKIRAVARLLRSLSNEGSPLDWHVFLTGISMSDSGAVIIEVASLPSAKAMQETAHGGREAFDRAEYARLKRKFEEGGG